MTTLPRPLELDLLVHYFGKSGHPPQHWGIREQNNTWIEGAQWLRTQGLLEHLPTDQTAFRVTPKGNAHVRALLQVPLPVRQYRTPWEETDRG